jgi:hypothetical protein
MWAAWVIAAIACGAAAFMVRFLVALLRESAPSVCYWVAPVARGSERVSAQAFGEDENEEKRRATSWQAALARDVSPSPRSRIFVRLRIESPWQSR